MDCDSFDNVLTYTTPILMSSISSLLPMLCIIIMSILSGSNKNADYTPILIILLYIIIPIINVYILPKLCKTSIILAWVLFLMSIILIIYPFQKYILPLIYVYTFKRTTINQ